MEENNHNEILEKLIVLEGEISKIHNSLQKTEITNIVLSIVAIGLTFLISGVLVLTNVLFDTIGAEGIYFRIVVGMTFMISGITFIWLTKYTHKL